jgi:hypothetical protein
MTDMPSDKGKGKGKTVDFWTGKGWEVAEFAAGDVGPIDVAYDPSTQDLAVKGTLYGADGRQLTGKGRPKVVVEQTETGGTIGLRSPSDEPVSVVFKIADEDADDEAETA